MTVDSTSRRTRLALLLAFALGSASLVLVIGFALTGHHITWTSWALPMIILGNVALMMSGIGQMRPLLAKWLGIASTAIAIAILAAEIRSL